jgi:predicted TIM-barrel fold metal-dependent hydrolase
MDALREMPQVSELTEGVIVVTADAHVGPPLSDLRAYCPAQYLDAIDEFIARSAEVSASGRETLNRRTGALTHLVTEPAMRWNAQTAGHYDGAARLADMDRDGIAAEIIFHGSQNNELIPWNGTQGVFVGPDQLSMEERNLRAVGRHIYNEWLVEFCASDPTRHIGLCQVPMWDIEASIKEVEWAHDHGLRGVNFPSPGPSLPSYEDPVWERFFATCAERNMVLNTHVGSTADLEPNYVGAGAQAIRYMEQNWLGRRALWLLTFTGAFDRHPNLKLAITELPGAWWAQTVREMDAAFYNPIAGDTVSQFLKRAPSEYAATNLFMGASYQSRQEASSAVEEGFEDRLMWGSDYPHIEGTWRYPEEDEVTPVTRLSIANTFYGLPESAIRKMLGQNAIDCYALDSEPLAELAAKIGPEMSEFASPPDLSAVPEGYVGFGFRTRGAYS